MISIKVRLAEPFWRSVGERELLIEVDDATSINDLIEILVKDYPTLKAEMELSPPTVFIGDQEANSHTILMDGARVHLVWPVAGG